MHDADEEIDAEVHDEEIPVTQKRSLNNRARNNQVPSESIANQCRLETDQQEIDDVETPQSMFRDMLKDRK